MEFFSFLVIILCFAMMDVAWWSAAHRRLGALPLARLWRVLLALFMTMLIGYLAMMLFHPTGRMLMRSGGPIPTVVHASVYLWHFMALPVLMVLMFAGMIYRCVRSVLRRVFLARSMASVHAPALDGGHSISPRVPPKLLAPTRRQIIAAVAMAVPPLAVGAASIGAVSCLYGRRLRSFNLMLPQLPQPLDGMRIVHISDTHIGKFLHPDRLPAIADDVNKLDADFIVFTGDLIDHSLDDMRFGIDFLRRLKSRCGLVLCEGNHDLMQDRGEFEQLMRDAELPIMVGEQKTLRYISHGGQEFPVQFLGTPWNARDTQMAEAIHYLKPMVRDDAFPIVLAHHPHSFDPASIAKLPLVLSGHTHGGQLMLNDHIGAGPIRFRYNSGLYQKDQSSLIVNNGLGNWFPLRINAPAEIVHLTLRRGT